MTGRTPSFWSASFRVFDFTVGELLWSRRTVFMALVVGGPVVLALVLRVLLATGFSGVRINSVEVGGPTLFGFMVWVFYLRFTVPVLAVFYGTALIADEVEDRTITYLFTRPIPRGAVLAGKYLAYLTCTALVVLPSVMLVYFLIVPLGGGSLGAAFPALVTDLLLLGLGLGVYGALFALVGAWLRRSLLAGLIFIFGWEPAIVAFPGYLKTLTVAHYLQALVPHAMPQDSAVSLLQAIFQDAPSPPVSLVMLGLIWSAALLLAVQVVERREFVLEQ